MLGRLAAGLTASGAAGGKFPAVSERSRVGYGAVGCWAWTWQPFVDGQLSGARSRATASWLLSGSGPNLIVLLTGGGGCPAAFTCDRAGRLEQRCSNFCLLRSGAALVRHSSTRAPRAMGFYVYEFATVSGKLPN